MNKFETPELNINEFEKENIVTASGLDFNQNGTLSVQGDATKFNLDSYND